MGYARVEQVLRDGKVVILDGGLGTELVNKGLKSADDPFIWSSRGLLDGPQIVMAVHREYIESGADVVTTAAFRTNSRALGQTELGREMSRPLTLLSVAIATQAKQGHDSSEEVAVAGNLTSVHDCYDWQASDRIGLNAFGEHKEKVEQLLEAQCDPMLSCDLVLIESMPSLKEAAAALKAARSVIGERKLRTPVWVSLTLKSQLEVPEPVLVDGTKVRGLFQELARLAGEKPDALLFNCCTPESITRAIPVLSQEVPGSIPIGAYANVELEVRPGVWRRRYDVTPTSYATTALGWIRDGARIVGGCCGTTPKDIKVLRKAIK